MISPPEGRRGSPGGPKRCPGASRDVFVYRAEGVNDACDLHAHTTASDGTLTPVGLVRYARDKGLRAVGICDHDTVSGVLSLHSGGTRPAYCTGGPTPSTSRVSEITVVEGVEVIPGVEINCQNEGQDIHILGYYTSLEKGQLRSILDRMRTHRRDRAEHIVRKLEDLGMPVSSKRVMELTSGDSIGRPHIAQAMVEKGYVSSVREAFQRYLDRDRPAYVERLRLEGAEAIAAIVSSGGVAVWAHPGTSRRLHLMAELVEAGLCGIEAFHPRHDGAMSAECVALAERYGLVVTGGSDFHGTPGEEGGDLGDVVVPYAVVRKLRELTAYQER